MHIGLTKETLRQALVVTLATLLATGLMAMSASAASTISTNISTGGTLSVTGASTLTGAVTMSSTASVAGDITLENSETISNATNGTITLGATSMVLVGTASTSAIKVGDEPDMPTINGLSFGFCTIASVTITASSTGMASCSTATGVKSGDRVFVQATSSILDNFVIQAASTTADAVIQVDILNIATTAADSGTDATGINSFNFWAVRP